MTEGLKASHDACHDADDVPTVIKELRVAVMSRSSHSATLWLGIFSRL
jgi:hypothetical protein